MAAGEIHVGDIGTVFSVTMMKTDTLVMSLVGATVIDFFFQKTDKSVITRTGTLVTDGSDGNVQYVAVSGDLDQAGNWQMQVFVTIPAGQFHSDITKFKVYPNLA